MEQEHIQLFNEVVISIIKIDYTVKPVRVKALAEKNCPICGSRKTELVELSHVEFESFVKGLNENRIKLFFK